MLAVSAQSSVVPLAYAAHPWAASPWGVAPVSYTAQSAPLAHLAYAAPAAHWDVSPAHWNAAPAHYAAHYAAPAHVHYAAPAHVVPVAVEGTYTAANRGAVHVAPLPGHTQSAASINLEAAPGTY